MIKRFKKLLNASLLSLFVIFSGGQIAQEAVFAQEIKISSENIKPIVMRTKAKSAIALDIDTGEIIMSKNASEKAYPASITKLMTALLLAENRKPTDEIPYTETAQKQVPFSINTNLFKLYKGDSITVEDGLKAILMLSANDIAEAASENLAKTKEELSVMMNEKAKSLGMKNTNFKNGVGLHEDDHYSTAYDISLMMKAAYKNEILKPILAMKTAEINTKWQKIGKIENKNILVGQNGNEGGKTGFTEEAGRTLTCVYSRNQNGTTRKIVVTLLGVGKSISDPTIFKDMDAIANEAFKVKKVNVLPQDEKAGSLTKDYKLFGFIGPAKKLSVPYRLEKTLEVYPAEENIKSLKADLSQKDFSVFSLKANDQVGTITLTGSGINQSVKVLSNINSMDSVILPNIIYYIGALIVLIIALIIIVAIVLTILRKRKGTAEKIRKKRHDQRRRKIRRYSNDYLN